MQKKKSRRRLYSRREAAAMLSISLASVQELLHQGLIAGVPMGPQITIHRDELERLARVGVRRIWPPKKGR
jgi:excisionase family DNA binding protein